ncbi:MAG TPA: guanylate kinase [Flavobacteriales bacterium]|nr:guanylate kinase [Flavobacteriales bacterium]HRQ84094.1 guanylate kinase [Flavobacteriales bacterium]
MGTGTPGKCIIVSAPSGAGKTTIVRYLLGCGLGLDFSISATNRPKRDHEQDGRDYFFITTAEFRQRIGAGAFVEWEEVYPGRYYGTLRAEIERIWANGRAPIFDVDVVGGLRLKEIFGEQALSIFVSPPTIEALEERLLLRGTETAETLRTRMDKAGQELAYSTRYDRILLNDDMQRACEEAYEVVNAFLSA